MTPTYPGPVDRLSALFERFSVQAHLFHTGPLCGVTYFDAQPGRGFLHVMRRGEMEVTHRPRSGAPRKIRVTQPSLLLYPNPLTHHFHNAPVEGADFVCATLDFDGGAQHPLVTALPPVMVVPLGEVAGIDQTLALLFSETERVRCGQRLLANRLFEVLLLQLLRWLLDRPDQHGINASLIQGLAHPKLAVALTAVHEQPGAPWGLDSMARAAGMSRSAFAAAFREQVGTTPAEYLLRWRVSVAQSLLLRGHSVKQVSDQLGYASAASFSRAFTQVVGTSPSAWRQAGSGVG